MTTAEEKAIQKAERDQRVKDLKLQKTLDKSWGISFHVVKDVKAEMNERLIQYRQQFKVFTDGFLIAQTMQDYQKEIAILQTGKKIEKNTPVAMVRKDQTIIILNDAGYFQ